MTLEEKIDLILDMSGRQLTASAMIANLRHFGLRVGTDVTRQEFVAALDAEVSWTRYDLHYITNPEKRDDWLVSRIDWRD